jgi:hypothetical protein
MNRPGIFVTGIVVAALLFGGSLIGAAFIIRDGLKHAGASLAASINHHSQVLSTSLPAAGGEAGRPIARSIGEMTARLQRPGLTIASPLDLKQPVRIEGPREDGSLPVDAGLGK